MHEAARSLKELSLALVKVELLLEARLLPFQLPSFFSFFHYCLRRVNALAAEACKPVGEHFSIPIAVEIAVAEPAVLLGVQRDGVTGVRARNFFEDVPRFKRAEQLARFRVGVSVAQYFQQFFVLDGHATLFEGRGELAERFDGVAIQAAFARALLQQFQQALGKKHVWQVNQVLHPAGRVRLLISSIILFKTVGELRV